MNIKEIRSKSKMTQKEFGSYFNIPVRTIQDWEGERRTPPVYVVELIEYKARKEGLYNMLDKLIDKAKKEIKKEMERVGYIDNSDNTARVLDGLAWELSSEKIGGSKDDYPNELEGMIEDTTEELLGLLQDYMKETYKEEGEIKDNGDYVGCYYLNENGLKDWINF